MSEYLSEIVKKIRLFSRFGILIKRFKGESEAKKINILSIIVLVLVARLFFLPYLSENVLAQKRITLKNDKIELVDPMEKVGKSFFLEDDSSYIEKKLYTSIKVEEKDIEIDQEKYPNFDLIYGYPMEIMIPEILKKDRKVAAFLLGIAKKESNWGKHSPKKDGKDCYNYWGYKGKYNVTNSGYSCFDSPDQAVEVVGKRIENLIEQKIDTPERMVVWKCGYDCSWDNPNAVKKWIDDVSAYYYKFNS